MHGFRWHVWGMVDSRCCFSNHFFSPTFIHLLLFLLEQSSHKMCPSNFRPLISSGCSIFEIAEPDGHMPPEPQFEKTGPGPCEPPEQQSPSKGLHANGPCGPGKRLKPLPRLIVPPSAAANS